MKQLKKILGIISALFSKLSMLISMRTNDLGKILKQSLDEYDIPASSVDISMMAIDSDGAASSLCAEKFLYAASLVKLYVAAEVFHQIDEGIFHLDMLLKINSSNVASPTDEIPQNRELLSAGHRATVHSLLERMLTYSDNTAANTLIDLAGMSMINHFTISKNGWQGSEITRKFLPREPGDKTPATVTCAAHVAELLEKLKDGTLLSQNSAKIFLDLLLQSQTNSIVPADFIGEVAYARKSGWYEAKTKNGFVKYVSDAGIITTPEGKSMIIVYLSKFKTRDGNKKFPSSMMARKLFAFLDI